MKVYIANVNNCEKYVEYAEENRGVYLTRQEAVEAMIDLGFEPTNKSRVISCHGVAEREEYRIEEWELSERTCKLERHGSLANYPEMVCWSCSECHFGWHHSINDKQFSYCPNCGAKVVDSE